MDRRALIKVIASAVLLAGGFNAPAVFAQNAPKLLAPPKVTSPLFHVFGVLPEPVEVKRIFAANASASVFVNSVAPKQLVGWPFELPQQSLAWLSAFSGQLPAVGNIDALSLEQLVALRPQIIIEVSEASESHLAQAKQINEQTGIPYVLMEGQMTDMPEQARVLGAILGHQRHGQQLAQVAQEVLETIATQRAASTANTPTVYVANSANGLETALKDTPTSELIRLVGAKNVADSAEPLTVEQVIHWNPDFILTQNQSFYESVYTDPHWKDLAAVQNKNVLFVPNVPFSWLEAPASINRLLGALWLSSTLYHTEQSVLIEQLRQVFLLYFGYAPTQQRLQELLNEPVAFAP